jgi:hypothetical protein
MRLFRQEPDLIAVAALALIMLVPAALQAGPRRGGGHIKLRMASQGENLVFVNPDAMEGFEDLVDWTSRLERRGERVWQRLSERMRSFEDRFERYSTAPPRMQPIHCETDSD